MSEFVWQPDAKQRAATTLAAFLRDHGMEELAELQRLADAEPGWLVSELVRFFDLRFTTPYHRVLDTSDGDAHARWCVGGETNLVANCLERHRGTPVWDKPAIVWESEAGELREWRYRELEREVTRLAAALRRAGIGRGDVVALYMPMLPETAAAFLAVVAIGAIVMPLFSGFGQEPLADRLVASAAVAAITVDAGWRRGRRIAMKATLDAALERAPAVRVVLVHQYAGGETAMRAGRDQWWHEVLGEESVAAFEPLPADAPAMLMYTSGTTGRAKGSVHTHCGMLVKNALDMGLCIDLKASDRLMWLSDMGWVAGPKVVVSSTLLGATLVMAEGVPDYPAPDRQWALIARHRVTLLGTVPTAIRQAMRHGVELVRKHDLTSLRALVTAGEPWNEDAWRWCFENVCAKRAPILNYGGGTECGGANLIGTFHHPLKPCAFGGPVPGSGADVVDAEGRSLPAGEMGELVLRNPSIGMTRGLWREDAERYLDTYWRRIPGMWVQGDLAMRDEDGLWYLLGRSDDTLKLAGKRVGPAEIEAALMATGLVLEAAAVGVPDALTGSALACVCVPGADPPADLAVQLSQALVARYGAAFRPARVLLASELPRTRNQKIMRRLVRAVLAGEPAGDLDALANPEALDALRAAARA